MRSYGAMFGILGPLTIGTGDSVQVITGARKQRTVLALLLMNRCQTMTINRMVDELWSIWPPDSAVANLRTYVSALRVSLGCERGRLITRPGGYLLRIGDNETDVDHFVAGAASGRRALRDGDVQSAALLLRSALALWRGRVFDDVALSPSLRMHVQALEEERLATLEDLMRARILLGEHAAVAADARRMLAADPTREPAWYLLVAALYEGGDPAGALRVYQQARQTLVDRLGLEPGPQLSTLQAEILRQRPITPLAVPRMYPPTPILPGK